MKNVLVLVHDDQGQEARLQCALDLTRGLNGHLICLHVTAPPVALGEFDGGVGQAMLVDIEEDRELKNKTRLEARLVHEDVPWSWQEAIDMPGAALLDAARLADVIVVNRKLDQGSYPDMFEVASRLVMHSGKPVLAVPPAARRLGFDRALVAWDGGASCAAATRAAVPLLALAKEVRVFTARDGASDPELAEAAEYLSRHGIHPIVQVVERSRHTADELIAQEAAAFRADYVVMGAYGRGRLMETFGGVTKRMLATASLPLLLAH